MLTGDDTGHGSFRRGATGRTAVTPTLFCTQGFLGDCTITMVEAKSEIDPTVSDRDLFRKWFCVRSVGDVARFFNRSERTVHTWVSSGMPRRQIDGNRYLYPLDEIFAWRQERLESDVTPIEHEQSGQIPMHGKDLPDNDPMLFRTDSYYGELYRKRKAKQVEIDNESRHCQLVRPAAIRAFLGAFIQQLAAASDVLRNRFGDQAVEIMKTALDECSTELQQEHFFGQLEDDQRGSR